MTVMKTIGIIFILLFLSILTALVTYHKPVSTEISVLGDITDSLLAKPDAKEIIRLYNFSNNNKWNAALFRFADVTDVSMNRTSEFKMESENKWLSNEPERDKEIKKFQSGISEVLSANESFGREHSSVYLPIAHELIRLSESKLEKRMLLVYSDLMENTPDLSFYDKRDFQLLVSNPDSLKKLFTQWEPLPSLNGIAVFLIYQPADIDADWKFKEVSGFYKKFLEDKGAQVNVLANLVD
jgi:hypothetical protein